MQARAALHERRHVIQSESMVQSCAQAHARMSSTAPLVNDKVSNQEGAVGMMELCATVLVSASLARDIGVHGVGVNEVKRSYSAAVGTAAGFWARLGRLPHSAMHGILKAR